jgi:hypothetical protein
MCNRKIQIIEKYSHYEIRICHCKKWEDGCFEELLAMNQLQDIPSEKCFIFSKCHLDLVLYLLGHLEITCKRKRINKREINKSFKQKIVKKKKFILKMKTKVCTKPELDLWTKPPLDAMKTDGGPIINQVIWL